MTSISRRTFLGTTTAAVAGVAVSGWKAFANPLGLPLGIQLYSVRQQMAQDLEGTLAAVAAAGFTEVEAAALPKRPAGEVRAALDKAGLRCVSSHRGFDDLKLRLEETVAYDKTLGVAYIICPSPGYRTPPAAGSHAAFTLDDWRYNAEQFNVFADKLAGAGVRFGYHNHVREFQPVEGKIPYMELLAGTDPAKVHFELDCGWAVVAGVNPVDIMTNHPHRIEMLHVKDFKAAAPGGGDEVVTELGRGSIDYRPVFAEAAKSQHIVHAFVEQEAFDIPWKDSLQVDAAYMRGLK